MISGTINNQTSTITNQFVWGLDLASATLSNDGVSGSLSGSGGVGGLLAQYRADTNDLSAELVFVLADGNGNVSKLVQVSSNEFQVSANYEYYTTQPEAGLKS